MVRKKVKENANEWKKSGKTTNQRIEEAHTNGLIASRVFDDPKTMPKIIAAIDSENYGNFKTACEDAGITDPDMLTRMWNATMGSLDPQGPRPCW
jgi:hypothetical protein